MTEEIRTRRQFLDLSEITSVCKFKDSPLSFREACFTLRNKVKKVIAERMDEVFKIDENKYQEYLKSKFEYGKKFAVKDKEGNIIYNNEKESSYNKDYAKFGKKVVEDDIKKWEDENGWTEFLNKIDKISKEREEWLDKKIKLNLKKVQKLSEIPQIIGTYNNAQVNENLAYSALVELLCNEKVECASNDGEEVE